MVELGAALAAAEETIGTILDVTSVSATDVAVGGETTVSNVDGRTTDSDAFLDGIGVAEG